MGTVRKSFARKLSLLSASIIALFGIVYQAHAIIDATLQMQLGNPTGATADPTNQNHYLIQRTVEALDYSDNLGEPNWASWDLTSSDLGSSGRSTSFYPDTSLPPSFYVVQPSLYNAANWDRGHMCPSADRTDNDTDNNQVFLMSNIIPQDSNMNSGVWKDFEDYCRSMLSTSELLITCGPRGFDTRSIAGVVYIASNVWKIVVCAPLGSGTALSRITNANPASIRVIAIDIPNAPTGNPWTSFVTSTRQLQALTGLNFFNALPNNLAWVLRSKVDGVSAAAPSITSFSPSSGPPSNSVTISGAALDTITNVFFNGTVASYTITAANQITALVPVGATSGTITINGLGGSAASASSFIVTAPVLPDFTVTPGSALTSSGDQGGPFSPSSQTYTLNNTNATSLSWGVGKTVSWLDLSATSGTLPAGTSTDITVSVSSAANSLLGGIYSDTLIFSNAATGGWVARSANLTVLASGQLSVSPVITFFATSQVGGPFSPSSQDYTLSNPGSISLSWTANATASWLNLSATSGTLAGGSSTVVTATVNSNAINLAQGSYGDVIGFTNTTNHAGDATRSVNLDVVSFGFFDNFGSFSSGDLVGQANWKEPGATNALWTFEGTNTAAYANKVGTTVGGITADVGSGVATGVHASAAATWTDVSGNGSPQSWSVNRWAVGDYFQFQVSTLGVGSIQIAWDQTSSSSGPRDFLLQYSTNGTTFSNITAFSVLANTAVFGVRTVWNFNVSDTAYHFSNDLSSITALDNQSNVFFRLVDNSTISTGGGTVGTTGTGRIDNFLVRGLDVAPIQIGGGAAWILAGQTAIEPDTWKDFMLTTNVTVFAGMVLNVTNAPIANSGTPSFFAALASATGGVGDVSMAIYELTAKAGDNANTNYVLGARTTGESGAPFVFGTAGLSYGTSYRVIIRTDPAGTNTIVYVSPTNGVLDQQTPYLTATGGAGITPATTVGSFVLTQSKNGSLATIGAKISKVCAASDYASVYSFLAIPPVASFTASPTNGTEGVTVTFTDTSTGSITNWFWDFGDGGTADVTTNSVSHPYYTPGTYTITLVVSGPDGVSTNIQSSYITVLSFFQVWQIQYFGSTNNPSAAETADADGDGQNNLAEFYAGTDPTNSASAFRITSVVRSNNDIVITWNCSTNASFFTVQTNSPPANGSYTNSFSDLSSLIYTAGGTGSYIHSGGATNVPARYYRVLLYLGPI